MSFKVEVVGEGGLDGCEFLQGFHRSKAQHSSLSSSKWQVTVLSSIVEMSPHVLTTGDTKSAKSSSIGGKTIRDDSLRSSVPFQLFFQELERGMPISFPGYKGIKDGVLLVDSAPEVERLVYDFHEDFVKVPTPVVRTLMQSFLPLFELLRTQSTKPVPPKPYCLVAYIDPSLVEQVFDLTQRQRIPHVHHDGELDDGRRSLEVAVRVFHRIRLRQGTRLEK